MCRPRPPGECWPSADRNPVLAPSLAGLHGCQPPRRAETMAFRGDPSPLLAGGKSPGWPTSGHVKWRPVCSLTRRSRNLLPNSANPRTARNACCRGREGAGSPPKALLPGENGKQKGARTDEVRHGISEIPKIEQSDERESVRAFSGQVGPQGRRQRGKRRPVPKAGQRLTRQAGGAAGATDRHDTF